MRPEKICATVVAASNEHKTNSIDNDGNSINNDCHNDTNKKYDV